MFPHRHNRVWGIVFAVIVVGGYFGVGALWRDNAKQDFVAEIGQFARFDEFEDLLLGVIEGKHAETYRRHNKRGKLRHVRTLNRTRYRYDMYRHVIGALKNGGHSGAASELRRFEKDRDAERHRGAR